MQRSLAETPHTLQVDDMRISSAAVGIAKVVPWEQMYLARSSGEDQAKPRRGAPPPASRPSYAHPVRSARDGMARVNTGYGYLSAPPSSCDSQACFIVVSHKVLAPYYGENLSTQYPVHTRVASAGVGAWKQDIKTHKKKNRWLHGGGVYRVTYVLRVPPTVV